MASVLVCVLASMQANLDQRRINEWFNIYMAAEITRCQVGKLLNEKIPKSELIVSSDIGAISYYANSHDFIDVYGLTTQKPLEAVRCNNWDLFLEWFKKMRPAYVADTYHNEIPKAIDILTNPAKFFVGLNHSKKMMEQSFTIVPIIKIPMRNSEKNGAGIFKILWDREEL